MAVLLLLYEANCKRCILGLTPDDKQLHVVRSTSTGMLPGRGGIADAQWLK